MTSIRLSTTGLQVAAIVIAGVVALAPSCRESSPRCHSRLLRCLRWVI